MINRPIHILIVDDVADSVATIAEVLEIAGYEASVATSSKEANARLQDHFVDLALVDERLGPNESGTKLLESWRNLHPGLGSILITGHGALNVAVGAMRAGALDFLQKPVNTHVLETSVARALELSRVSREARYHQWAARREKEFPEIIGSSESLRRVLELVPQIAAAPAPALILGESGTGKELIARAIHQRSPRRESPFVAVNAGAIQPTLVASELFGVRKGAFTGAAENRPGYFEVASGGTLFLDEIGEIPSEIQIALLRVLQEKVITRVGDSREIPVDTRIIAATHQDLKALIQAKKFREDLYYRLAVAPIHLPPLRQRIRDIPELAKYLVRKRRAEFGYGPTDISPEAIEKLQRHTWPGNIRELENVLVRALMVSKSTTIQLVDLEVNNKERLADVDQMLGLDFANAKQAFERLYFTHLLDRAGGNKTKAAELAGINRTTIYEHLD